MAKGRKSPRSKKKASTASPEFMEKLKQFVRTHAEGYLQDSNITSVGIGYKVTDGKPTKELAIQFTVGTKVAPELLPALDTQPIPPSVVIDGVEVPTDVLQRSYETSFKIVPEALSSSRKTRIDPIVPGVSVANTAISAGTIGCIVFDRRDGTPYILSNWHVLNGPLGDIGDTVVQPGPHDDNRTRLNRLGKLVRSHLGAAGDCAVASIEDRAFEQEILVLGVKPDKLGEPDLGDKVIKSGRTTDVTHGVVTRVHTVAKIDYGDPVGEQSVGAFEIGLDEDNLPDNGEISMGGDSGSIWLFKSTNGKPTKVIAGLHFAGEVPSDPHEHALACYAGSVFEKLEISLEQPDEPVDPEAAALGYATNFLGPSVALPKLSSARLQDAVKLNGKEVINYTHFSLTLSKSRRFAFWVAWNIDGGRLKRLSRKNIKFILDPRVPQNFQVGDELYAGNRLDRGHIARRADLLWGGDAEAKKANVDSFFFTNITPQMDNFNQSSMGGIWGRLEDAVFEQAEVDNLRVSAFGGPVFRNDDRIFRGVKIPREFFKVLAFVESGKLKASAFILSQSLNQLEALDLNEFKVFQVTLAEVESRCGFKFPNNLKAADGFAETSIAEAVEERPPLGSLDDIIW
jgi:endonuclease G, mitochondrial